MEVADVGPAGSTVSPGLKNPVISFNDQSVKRLTPNLSLKTCGAPQDSGPTVT